MTAPDRDELPALAGEYVLGLMNADELRGFERAMQDDDELRRIVGEWRDRFLEVDHMTQLVPPSSALWPRIARSIHNGVTPDQPEANNTSWSWLRHLGSSLNFWRATGLAGAAAALLIAIFAGTLSPRQPARIAVAVLADEQAPDAPPGAIIEAYADGSVRLLPLRDITAPSGRTLQVWTLWDRTRGPVPLGLMQRAVEVRLSGGDLPRPQAEQLYEITLEPAGGSPTGRPTGPVLYKGLAKLTL